MCIRDRATATLDQATEAQVLAAGEALAHRRTSVIVAHRLASIRGADRVLFLEHGRIVEDGGIEELRAAGGRFAAFWEQQRAAADWQIGH